MSKENEIPMKEAREIHRARSKKARKIDECKTHSVVLDKPTTAWSKSPGKSDVKGIDMPSSRVKPYKRKKKGGTKKTKPVKAYYRKTSADPTKCGKMG